MKQSLPTDTTNTTALPAGDDQDVLAAGDDQAVLPSGDDLADKIIAEQTDVTANSDSEEPRTAEPEPDNAGEDEAEQSDELATTLYSLQHLIERRANELVILEKNIKELREQMRNVFENDAQLSEAQAQLSAYSEAVKQRKGQMQTGPEVVRLKVQASELAQQKKEMEETLSNHLINYHQLTNSTSFDTSDGDQWEFQIRAKIKPRKVQD